MIEPDPMIDHSDISDKRFSEMQETYALLEPLLSDYLTPEQKRLARAEACRLLGISERTLFQYLKDFRERGTRTLVRKTRSDAGTMRKVTKELLDKVKELLTQNPHRSIPFVLRMIASDETLAACAADITSAAVHYHLRKSGFDIRKARSSHSNTPFRHFEANYANQLWQSDARHGFHLPHPTKPNVTRMTYCYAFIDDYSRKILDARYYWDEKLPRLEECMRVAILRWGIPERLYVDNGAAYASRQFFNVTESIGIKKIHHPPYQAWCKGKVEAIMKLLKKFQREAELAGMSTLEELNETLAAWIEIEYNRKIHSQTGEIPNVRFQNSLVKYPAKRVTDIDSFNAHFLWRDTRVIDKHGMISLESNKYRIRDIGIGESVEIRYNPFDLSSVYVYRDKKHIATVSANTLTRTECAHVPEENKKPAHAVSKEARAYFTSIREKHLSEKTEDAFRVSNIIKNDTTNEEQNHA